MEENPAYIMREFKPLAEGYIKEASRLFPTRSTELGIHDYDHELENYSPEGLQEIEKFISRFSGELDKFDPKQLREADAIDHSLMRVELDGYAINYNELRNWERDPVLYLEHIQESSYYLISRTGTPWEERTPALLSRLKKYPALIRQAAINLKSVPKIFIENAIESTQGIIGFLKNTDMSDFPVAKSLSRDLEKQKVEALNALEGYESLLKGKRSPHSDNRFAIGKSAFDRILKETYLLPYSTDELLEIGRLERENTLKELNAVAASIDPNKPWLEILRENERDYPPPEDLLDEYRKTAQKAKEFVAGKHLAPIPADDKMIVKETPLFDRPFTGSAGYNCSPPFEKGGQGEFLVTPVSTDLPPDEQRLLMQDHTYHIIPVISAHEAYPGHHLQFTCFKELESPMVRRSFALPSIEGWGLYCEQLMREEGFYGNPVTDLFQLKDQLWRVIRVTLDVGLQTETLALEQAASLLTDVVNFSKSFAWSEVKRFSRKPTVAMSYLIGKLEILKLREMYRRKRKELFNLHDFHRDFLECGSVPLKLAEEKLAKTI